MEIKRVDMILDEEVFLVKEALHYSIYTNKAQSKLYIADGRNVQYVIENEPEKLILRDGKLVEIKI